MPELRTIILAAGKGTRMRSDTAKVLHKVCGRPILSYVLDASKAVGSLKTYVVLGHKIDEVRKCLDKGLVAVEQKKLLGTADAIRSCERMLRGYRGNILVLCGDTPLLSPATVRQIVKKHKASNAECTFLTAVVHEPQGYGRVIRGEENKVMAIREDKDALGLEKNIKEINVGVYCFKSRELFSALREIKLNPKKKEFYLTDVIDLFFKNDFKIETVETGDPSEGLGVNSREDLAVAEGFLRRKILRQLMMQGVTIIDPDTTYIDADVRIGQDTVVRPFSVIENNVRIGSRCLIGPFCRLRPGTVLQDDVEVGNFTEISRSRIGRKTVMKHFSFLGDATVGSGVNIGAGAVTANYDGQKKHPTRIADGAFIGSDAILIAPAKVGKKAVVGAGSVLPQNRSVPDGKIAFGVPAKIVQRRKTT